MKTDDPRLDELHEVLIGICIEEGIAESEDSLGAIMGVVMASMVVCAEEQGIAGKEIFRRARACVDHLAQVAGIESAGITESATKVLQ